MPTANLKLSAKHILLQWFDSNAFRADGGSRTIDWLRVIPFILIHLSCLLVFVVGYSSTAIYVAIISYYLRMFAITAFYHRYFSHRAFKTSRLCQFLFALLGASATQRGPLWWAAHHRRHHRYSDQDLDVHSPRHGFIWSHMGWFLCLQHFNRDDRWIRDFIKFPELRWLDRFDMVIPLVYAAGLWLLGYALQNHYPQLATGPWQLLIWGYSISTVILIHCTVSVNSLAHKFGTRRYDTQDDSRNNAFLALITLGEGWHNNHHYYPVSARQGFFWWEIDISYYLLRVLAGLGLIWDLNPVPSKRIVKSANQEFKL